MRRIRTSPPSPPAQAVQRRFVFHSSGPDLLQTSIGAFAETSARLNSAVRRRNPLTPPDFAQRFRFGEMTWLASSNPPTRATPTIDIEKASSTPLIVSFSIMAVSDL